LTSTAFALRPQGRPPFDPAFYVRVVYPFVLLIWLFGAAIHAQRWLTGDVFVYSVHAKLMLLTLVCGWWILTNLRWGGIRFAATQDLSHALLAVIAYLSAASVIAAVRFGYQIGYLAFAANAMAFYLVFMLLFMSFPKSYLAYFSAPPPQSSIRRRADVLLLIATPIMVLGVLQHLLDSPILPEPDSDDDYLRFIHVDFVAGGTRAFSIFTSGWALGEFVVFVSLIALALWINTNQSAHHRRLAMILFWLFAAITAYTTLTRAIYLQFALSTFGLFLISRSRFSDKRIVSLALLLCAVAIVAVFGIALSQFLVGDWGIADNLSLYARVLHWLNATSLILADGRNLVFGTGLIANDRYELTRGLIVDNLYLALVLYGGLLGLAAFAWAFIRIFLFAIRQARRTADPFWLALASFYFSVPASGFLNDQHNTPALLFALVWAASTPTKRAMENISGRSSQMSPVSA
jgi:hypothetical protein